jgi:pimeloyl-ACP methyl ester carboxylesterase
MPFADLPTAHIYYESHGEGPWLVFAHGAGGNHLSWWRQVPHFASRHRCLVYDQPGWGRSTAHGAPNPTRFGSDLVALLDHLHIERAALVGQSMGGWAVFGCALAIPARVSHVLLASTLAGLTDDATKALLLEAIPTAPGAPLDGRAALASDFPSREPALTFLFEQITALNPPLEGPFLRALVTLQLTTTATLPFALALVSGDRDRLFPLPLIQLAHARVPDAALTVVPGAGHSVYFERPDEFNRALDTLLAR